MISMNRIFLALCLLGSSARPALVRAADDKMLELAKKEARVSFYTTMGADEAKMLADAFQSKYPSMRVEITRLGSEKLLQRIITENRAGSHLFDAVTNSGMEIYLLTKMGLLARYTTPEFSSFMADSKDPAGRWVDLYSNLRMIGYNTRLVPKENVFRHRPCAFLLPLSLWDGGAGNPMCLIASILTMAHLWDRAVTLMEW